MNLISIDNVSKNVKEIPLFSNVSFGIEENEHIGFVGPNGCGKSTFLKVLLGEIPPDTGCISRNKNISIGFLAQKPCFSENATVKSFLYESEDELFKIAGEYSRCLQKISSNRDKVSDSEKKEFEKLSTLMEQKDGFSIEHTYESYLDELGITDLDAKMSTLSGGMVKKAAIARLFTAKSPVIFLDEPTNHLDVETIEWLEKKLSEFQGSFILVTHDRYFLDNVCNIMMDLDRHKISRYEGNFSTYLRRKQERTLEENRHDEKRNSILAVELEWLKRGPKARALKDSHRKERTLKLLAERENKEQDTKMEGFSSATKRLGGKILNIENLSKIWVNENSRNEVIKKFSYEFSKGERIGVIGPNGCGKSTFLDIISGRTSPTEGNLDFGVNTFIGYFDQTALKINRDLTVLEFMKEKCQHVRMKDGSMLSVEQFLEKFLFPHSMFNQKLAYLSGGELRRLQLIQILSSNPNFLLFDEPTNDFDIETISLVEDFLRDFEGCILVVSHDRAFLDNVTDFLFVFDGQGNISKFVGNYADYREFISESEKEVKKIEKTEEKSKTKELERKRKLSFKEKKEFDSLLDEISVLEDEKLFIEDYFSTNKPDTKFSHIDSMQTAQKRYEEITALIEQKSLRWEELAEFAE